MKPEIKRPQEGDPILMSPIERLPIAEAAQLVIQILTRARCHVLVAGGAVRDHLLGKLAKDIDLCTDAKPEELIKILEEDGIKVLPAGQKFGIVIAVVNGEQIEIATFRTDGYSSDSRHPDEITIGVSPAEDAMRRDLTVNGLFYDPNQGEQGTIIDHVGGVEDMGEQILRFIGNPAERVGEDDLRMLRYVRFLVKTGFKADEESNHVIRKNAHLIKSVSVERIRDEFGKIWALGKFSDSLRALKDLNLLEHVLPEEVSILVEREQIAADQLSEDASMELRWAAVLYETDIQDINKFCGNKGIKMSNKERGKIVWLCENVSKVFELSIMDIVDAKRFVLMSQLNDENPHFEDLLSLAEARFNALSPSDEKMHKLLLDARKLYEDIKKDAEARRSAGCDLKRLITGKDIMQALGLKKGGPLVGKTQRRLEDLLLAHDGVPTREDGLAYLNEIAED